MPSFEFGMNGIGAEDLFQLVEFVGEREGITFMKISREIAALYFERTIGIKCKPYTVVCTEFNTAEEDKMSARVVVCGV